MSMEMEEYCFYYDDFDDEYYTDCMTCDFGANVDAVETTEDLESEAVAHMRKTGHTVHVVETYIRTEIVSPERDSPTKAACLEAFVDLVSTTDVFGVGREASSVSWKVVQQAYKDKWPRGGGTQADLRREFEARLGGGAVTKGKLLLPSQPVHVADNEDVP